MRNNEILFILRDCNNGGEATMLRKLTKELNEKNINFRIISFLGFKSKSPNKRKVTFLKKIFLGKLNVPHPQNVKTVMQSANKSNHVMHFIFDLHSILFFFSSYLKNKKNIITFHTNLNIAPPYLKSLYNYLVKIFQINLLTPFAVKIIFLTHGQKSLYRSKCCFKKLFDSKVQVIPNFIDKKHILKSKKEIRQSKSLNLIYVGRLTKTKGFHDLITVMKQLDNNFKLTVIGEGPLEDEAKKLSNIKLIGKVPNEKIFDYHDQNHIFILPSYTEVFPLTILEAMSRGLAILTTKIPGIDEIIRNRQNGFLFSPGDVDKLKQFLLFCISEEDKIKAISENNLSKINLFTGKNIISQYEKAFNDRINNY